MTCLDGQSLHRRVFLTVILTPFSTEISVTGSGFDAFFFYFFEFYFLIGFMETIWPMGRQIAS